MTRGHVNVKRNFKDRITLIWMLPAESRPEIISNVETLPPTGLDTEGDIQSGRGETKPDEVMQSISKSLLLFGKHEMAGVLALLVERPYLHEERLEVGRAFVIQQ